MTSKDREQFSLKKSLNLVWSSRVGDRNVSEKVRKLKGGLVLTSFGCLVYENLFMIITYCHQYGLPLILNPFHFLLQFQPLNILT